jgi:hypothetical protein
LRREWRGSFFPSKKEKKNKAKKKKTSDEARL